MEYADLEFSWSAGLRNIFVMTEVQKVNNLLIETGFCVCVLEESGAKLMKIREPEQVDFL